MKKPIASLKLLSSYSAIVVLMGCSSVPKPNVKGCGNLGVGGYGFCVESQTEKVTVLGPNEWAEKKAGPGFWFDPEEIAKQKKFTLIICEKTNVCADDAKKEINQKFDLFLNKPEVIQNLLKEKK